MTKKPLQTALPELDQRAKELLGAVVREYIATAEPVASAQLVRRYRLEVSAATVRVPGGTGFPLNPIATF